MKLSQLLATQCAATINDGFEAMTSEAPALMRIASRLAAIADGLRNGNSSAEMEACRIADDARTVCDRINGAATPLPERVIAASSTTAGERDHG